MSNMPQQKPGRSKQDYGTPKSFLQALKHKLGIEEFSFDLAASPDNTVAEQYFTEEDNSLVQNWTLTKGWQFLNPPFSHITPWVKKALMEGSRGASIAMLIPASTGSNWWFNFVHQNAHILLLNGRITFVGCDAPYPKDCALLLFDKLYTPFGGGYATWKWSHDLTFNL